MAGRIIYITRGGDLASRADEVISHGSVGPHMGDWSGVDRAELRKDAIVGRELVSTISHLLSHEAMDRIGRTHAKEISELFNVPVYYAVHGASAGEDSDWCNAHIHFNWPAREVDADGRIGDKTRVLDNRNTSGAVVAQLRSRYQDMVNREFVSAGVDQRLDLRSFKAQKFPFEAQQRVPKLEFQLARRGAIHSPRYAKNQALIALRTTTAAVAHATASFTRICRTLAVGIVLRRRAARIARRRAAGRSLDRTRTPALVARSRFPANRGGGSYDGNGHGPKRFERELRTDLAVASPTCQRSGDPVPALDTGRIVNRDRSGRSAATDRSQMGTRSEHRESGILTPQDGSLKSPTLMARIEHWFTRTSRQKFVADESRTDTVVCDERSDPPTAEKSKEIGPPATVAQVSHEATVAACEDVVPGAEIDGQQPLVKITTQAGRVHYMRREAWQTAKENGARDVALCQWNGEPISSDGSKKTLRVSTLRECELTPMALPNTDGWLHPEQNSESRLSV